MIKLINPTNSTLIIKFRVSKTQGYTKKISRQNYLTITEDDYKRIDYIPKSIEIKKYNLKGSLESEKIMIKNTTNYNIPIQFERSSTDKYSKLMQKNSVLTLKEEEFSLIKGLPKGVVRVEKKEEKPKIVIEKEEDLIDFPDILSGLKKKKSIDKPDEK